MKAILSFEKQHKMQYRIEFVELGKCNQRLALVVIQRYGHEMKSSTRLISKPDDPDKLTSNKIHDRRKVSRSSQSTSSVRIYIYIYPSHFLTRRSENEQKSGKRWLALGEKFIQDYIYREGGGGNEGHNNFRSRAIELI